MMKLFRSIALLATLPMLLMTSCKDDDGGKRGFGDSVVKFNTEISSVTQTGTRASGVTWDAGDQIGIYMKTAGSTLAGAAVLADNKEYETGSGSATFTPVSGNEIYFPADGSNVDFVAYYPYTSTITDFKYPVNVSNQTDWTDIDFMFSNDATNLNRNSADVTLGFDHMLSQVVLRITDQSGDAMTGAVVTLQDFPTTAEFNLATQQFGNIGGEGNLSTKVTVSSNTAEAQAIVIPSTGLTGASATITVAGSGLNKTFDFPASQVLLSGKRHIFNITITTTGEVQLTPDSGIEDWEDQNEGDFTIGGDPAEGDGTESNPFTIDQVAANIGENNVWVSGFVVDPDALLDATSKTSIALAATAGETARANVVIVELEDGSELQDQLNLVDNADLLGKKIQVRGDIAAAGVAGGIALISNLSAQIGGNNGSTDPGDDELEFYETLGEGTYGSGNRPLVNDFTDWDMKAPIVYSDQYGNADIRSTSTVSPSVWLPAQKNSELKIEGIGSGYKNMVLTVDVAANQLTTKISDITYTADIAAIKVYTNGSLNSEQLTGSFTKANEFITVTINIPDNTTSIRFFAAEDENYIGYRLDNIGITGSK